LDSSSGQVLSQKSPYLAHTGSWQSGRLSSSSLSASGYIYNSNIFEQNAAYAEFSATLHYQGSFSGKIAVAPNACQRHVTVPGYELNYRRDMSDTVQFSGGGLGYTKP